MIEFFDDDDDVLGTIEYDDGNLVADITLQDVADAWIVSGRDPADFEDAYVDWSNGYVRSRLIELDDESDTLIADAVTFHLPGQHNQKSHGNRKGKTNTTTRTDGESTATKSPKSTTARGILDSPEMRELIKDSSAFESNMQTKSDRILAEIARQRGFDKKPELASAERVNELWASGQPELWRGVSDARYVDEFKTGDYYAGAGIYGNGTYTFAAFNNTPAASQLAQIFVDASGYARGNGTRLRMTLKPGSRVAKLSELKDDIASEQRRLRNERSDARDRGDTARADELNLEYQIISDPGRFAALNGYQALEIGNVDGNGELIILDRGATVVDKEM